MSVTGICTKPLVANDIGHLEEGVESFFLKPPRSWDAVEAGDFESIERIGDGAQMLGWEMQVDEGVLQPGMSEQDLHGTQVGAVLEKMGGTTMPQSFFCDPT